MVHKYKWLSSLIAFFIIFFASFTLYAAEVSLIWDPSSGPVNGYRIYYGNSSGYYTNSVDVGNVTEATITGLDSSKTYYFVVRAYNQYGESGNSNELVWTASVTDTTPPVASGYNPSQNATGVPVNSNIVFQVADSGSGVNQASITMTVNGQQVTPSITGSTSDYTVTYDPPSDFGYNSVVTVTINASDLAGNAMAPVSYSFTTEADTTPPAPPTGVSITIEK